jgi:hypothetical protein
MTRGETLKILVDYDLYGVNVKDHVGVYVKTDQFTGKHLVYFFGVGEWAEFEDDTIERENPDFVSPENRDFVSQIKTMTITFPT